MRISLKAERLNRGLSVKAAAEQIGIPEHTVWTSETGIQPRPETAKRIADFYEVKVTDIWPIDGEVAA